MKSFLTVWLCVGILLSSSAQDRTDSLKQLLYKATLQSDSAMAAYYATVLGYEYFNNIGNCDSAAAYYRLAISIDRSPKATHANALNGLAGAFNETGFADSALHYFQRAHQLATQLADSALIVTIETNVVATYKDLGLYDEALENAFRLLRKLEREGKDRETASCYSTIAFVYEKIGDYEKALEYHQRALVVRKQLGRKRLEALSYTNIGEVYLALELYDSALSNLFRAMTIKQDAGDRNGLSSTLNIIGEALLKSGDLPRAEEYFKLSAALKREFNDRADLAVTLTNLAELELARRHLPDAERHLREAEDLARETGSPNILRRVLEIAVRIYRSNGNHAEAMAVTEELMQLKDRLLTIEKERTLRALTVRFETEKKDEEIAWLHEREQLSQSQLETRKIAVISLTGILVLLAAVAGLIYYNFRTEKQSKQRVELLMKELHHRVKNNLQILSSIFMLQAQRLTDQNAIEAVRAGESRVNAMALIHRRLYHTDDNREINLHEYISELVQYLVHSFGYTAKDLRLTLNIETNLSVDVDKAIPVGLILNEIVSNALKHAYNGHANPQLGICATLTEKNYLSMEINDNGRGIPEGQVSTPSHSFGLSLISTLVQQLRGNFEIRNNNGTHIYLHIPISS